MFNIKKFHTNYYFSQGTSDQPRLQRRLDNIVHQKLSQLVGIALHSAPQDRQAVYRIRHLHLNLCLNAPTLQDVEVAERWAKLLVHGIVRTILYGSRPNVVRFEDEAHYLASFVIELLAGRAWTHWEYEEFHAYRDLPPGRVAATILAAQPDLLLPIARRLLQPDQLTPLIRKMAAQDVKLVWERGLGFRQIEDLVADLEAYRRILSDFTLDLSAEHARGTPLTHLRLHLYLLLCLSQPLWSGRLETAVVAHHLAIVNVLYQAMTAPWLWQALAREEVDSPAAVAPLLATLEGTSAGYGSWLVEQLSAAAGRAKLAKLVAVVVPVAAASDLPDPEFATGPAFQRVRTSFAGLALLLPLVRQWEWAPQLGRFGLYQLMIDLVEPRLRPLAWGDTGLQWLCALEPHETQAARAADINWPTVATSDIDDKAPYLPASQALLRHFAATLRGFSGSSLAYVGKNFISLPGHVTLSNSLIEVRFTRAPLGILLEMAGHIGEQGALPWLNQKELVIRLPG